MACLSNCSVSVLAGLGIGAAGFLAFFLLRKKNKSGPKLDPTLPKGTVLLHQFPMAENGFSLSPFPIKLETFLRINNIPYKVSYENYMSSKNKCPWMEFNGEATADSQFCIDRLNRELGIDMNKHLTPEQKGASRAFVTLIEESLYWILVSSRWIRSIDELAKTIKGVPTVVLKTIAVPKVKKQLWAQGTGRHSVEEQWIIFQRNIDALGRYLGTNPYLMGDAVSEVDCTAFAMLFQAFYNDFEKGKHAGYISENHPNLIAYVDRMKAEFWPETSA